jgi:hypothetical protein
MQKIYLLILLLLVTGCNANPQPTLTNTPTAELTMLPQSMKGYELYSWQEQEAWYFTLTTGTNRNKTVEEIKASEDIEGQDGWVKITVTGMQELKNLLARLPQGENVFWVDELIFPAEFALPPGETMDDIQEFAGQLGLVFYVSR